LHALWNSMPSVTPEQAITQEAYRLGFAAIGFAASGEAVGSHAFDRWLDQGYAGGMTYLRRHAPLRRNPNNITPSVKSIIALLARYPTNPSPTDGGFCMLARLPDYHDVLRRKLRELTTVVKACTSTSHTRICVDSAPLPEREWAIRAGLGWQGRQGQLISPVAGTCSVLGFILTDAILNTSEPIDNHCQECRLCVESCPSEAIRHASQLDARRCISYLTIEHDGDIATELQDAIGNALFGCDICTSICPWNQRASATIMPEFANPASMPDAKAITMLSPEAFASRFHGTTIKRSGHERLMRNAAICLKNRKRR
jgi:epoxyqueuosine reductase